MNDQDDARKPAKLGDDEKRRDVLKRLAKSVAVTAPTVTLLVDSKESEAQVPIGGSVS